MKEYEQLREAVEEARDARERARGAYDATIGTLRLQFDVGNLKEAKELLEKYESQSKDLEGKIETLQKQFVKKWKHLIPSISGRS